MSLWSLSWRADPAANRQAKRHYTCQSPGSDQFVPPGSCLVLHASTPTGSATWATSWPLAEYTKHGWAGAWVCSIFRNEGAGLSSDLIRDAVAATAWRWPDPPSVAAWRIERGPHASRIAPIRVCMVTMVDRTKTTAKRDPGRCFRRAGFVEIGETREERLVVLGLPVDDLPRAAAPAGTQLALAL